jgi:arginyl-tRNA synthetase
MSNGQTPQPTESPTGTTATLNGDGGIIAAEERLATEAISRALVDLGFQPRSMTLRPIPFAGTWGAASSVCYELANEAVTRDLEASGQLEGLSKKEVKRLAADAVRGKAQELAEQIAATVMTSGNGFARVEAVNGYINVYFDANVVAARLIAEVLGQGATYGHGAAKTDRVMVEHSQLNTHKAAHIGHMRNMCLGVAVERVLRVAGYQTVPATYIGDIGLHVIKCLWCYDRFHRGEEPADPAARGRWLGDLYAEADQRLGFRAEVLDFLLLLAREDAEFVAAIDRLLKYLWRNSADKSAEEGEDIAYLLGRITHAQEIKPELLRRDAVIPEFWPIVGDQLRDSVLNPKPYVPVDGQPDPTTTPEERLARWQALAERMPQWWAASATWPAEIKELFQRWDKKDPAFVQLWEETRGWSLADLRRIFDELEATFDVWFFESEVEEEGRAIVQELLEKEIAEVSEGLPVVKIDEKLGITTPTYRTLPILRSDGTTLYATKDLALTKRKFEDYPIDRALWVVDVRQSLYFEQIVKILELWGFEQAARTHHLAYEFVKLTEGVISSRKGNVPVYEDVRDAVLTRARAVIDEKNPDLPDAVKAQVARDVGLGSLKYAMLTRDHNKVVVFDLDEALSFDGHAAPYIQYAHARACRILEHGEATDDTLNAALADLDFQELAPEELGLLQGVASLPDEVQRAAAEERPQLIASYVYELAKRFNDFYHACPVLQSAEPKRTARLALVAATRQVLANGLWLLGIAAPRAM